MSSPTERELRQDLADLRATADRDVDDVRVTWGEAAPAERPDGMTWTVHDDDDEGEPDATLQYDLWSAQRDVLDAVQEGEHDVVAFLAGYGTGKSVFGARWTVAQALAYPGSKFLAMGVDFQKARDTTYPKLFAALPGERTTRVTADYNGPEHSPIVDDYNRQEHRLTFINDAEVVLGSADKYSRYAGAEFGGVWMDEPSHYGETLHDLTGMITTRLRGVDGPKTMVWTLTGEGYNAAWEILEQRQDADGEPLGLEVEVVRGSVLNNPYLAAGDKDRFRRRYEGTGQEEQALHGGFAAATGLVYSAFQRDTHVLDAAEADRRTEDGWRMYGYDAGWADPRVLLEIGRTSYGQLVVLDEFHRSGSHVKDVIAWLEDGEKPTGTIHAEHEPSDIDKFQRAGWPVAKAEKSIDAGISEVRRRFQDDGTLVDDGTADGGAPSVWYDPSTPSTGGGDGARGEDDEPDEQDDEEGRVGLLVSDRCQRTVRELLGYKEDHVGTSKAVDHCADALRYAVMGYSGGTSGSTGDDDTFLITP